MTLMNASLAVTIALLRSSLMEQTYANDDYVHTPPRSNSDNNRKQRYDRKHRRKLSSTSNRSSRQEQIHKDGNDGEASMDNILLEDETVSRDVSIPLSMAMSDADDNGGEKGDDSKQTVHFQLTDFAPSNRPSISNNKSIANTVATLNTSNNPSRGPTYAPTAPTTSWPSYAPTTQWPTYTPTRSSIDQHVRGSDTDNNIIQPPSPPSTSSPQPSVHALIIIPLLAIAAAWLIMGEKRKERRLEEEGSLGTTVASEEPPSLVYISSSFESVLGLEPNVSAVTT